MSYVRIAVADLCCFCKTRRKLGREGMLVRDSLRHRHLVAVKLVERNHVFRKKSAARRRRSRNRWLEILSVFALIPLSEPNASSLLTCLRACRIYCACFRDSIAAYGDNVSLNFKRACQEVIWIDSVKVLLKQSTLSSHSILTCEYDFVVRDGSLKSQVLV